MELLAQSDGPVVIGTDAKSNEEIVSKVGPYGPYVQRGETTERKSIPKHIDPLSIDLETALALLNLPRTVGAHPGTGEEITADYGRYGPYLRMVKKTRSLKDPDTPLDITVERAVELLEQVTSDKSEALKELGKHPKTGEELTIKSGRYGPFISDGKVNAAIPKGVETEDLSLEDAVELIDKRRLNPPKKRRRKRKKS
jgi:DNA topoisomerase-1